MTIIYTQSGSFIRSLSDSLWASLASSTSAFPTPTHAWEFDFLTLGETPDTGNSAENAPGTVTDVILVAAGDLNSASYYNHSSSYVNCGTPSDLNPNTESFSFTVWAKIAVAEANNKIIIGKTNSYRLAKKNGTNKISWAQANAVGTFTTRTASYATADGEWHYYGITRDSDGAVMYIDAEVAMSSSDFASTIRYLPDVEFMIGNQSGSNQAWVSGSIDRVRFYCDTFLTPAQIEEDYSGSLSYYL